VTSFDGYLESDPFHTTIEIIPESEPIPNVAPLPPTAVTPASANVSQPLISWSGAVDPDSGPSTLSYFVKVGLTDGGNEVVDWTHRTVPNFTPAELVNGTYFVEIVSHDGQDNSVAIKHQLVIQLDSSGGEGNVTNSAPSPPTSLSPSETNLSMPLLAWSGATDAEGDVLQYSLRITRSPSGEEIVAWTNWSAAQFYDLSTALQPGAHEVQIRAFDGELESETGIFSLTILESEWQPGEPILELQVNLPASGSHVAYNSSFFMEGTSGNLTHIEVSLGGVASGWATIQTNGSWHYLVNTQGQPEGSLDISLEGSGPAGIVTV